MGNAVVWRANPDWRGMVGFYVKGVLMTALATGVAYLASARADLLASHFIVLAALAGLGMTFGIGYLIRHTTLYEITENAVSEKSGILNTKREQARVEQITNITVERTIAERIMGIGRVNIDTANDRTDILDWWGIRKPYEVERIIDELRLEADEES
jgi:uncharacterized membrane protein YdbT with pleckstrin-like domain